MSSRFFLSEAYRFPATIWPAKGAAFLGSSSIKIVRILQRSDTSSITKKSNNIAAFFSETGYIEEPGSFLFFSLKIYKNRLTLRIHTISMFVLPCRLVAHFKIKMVLRLISVKTRTESLCPFLYRETRHETLVFFSMIEHQFESFAWPFVDLYNSDTIWLRRRERRNWEHNEKLIYCILLNSITSLIFIENH